MLQKLPEPIPVTGTVSNLDGTQETGLQIKEERMDGILNSKYVKIRIQVSGLWRELENLNRKAGQII